MEVPEDAPIMQRRLSVSVRRGELNQKRAVQAVRWVDKEIRKLIDSIKELGRRGGDGKVEITFGELFQATQNRFEALTGTLRTAKKRKVWGWGREGVEGWSGREMERKRKRQKKGGDVTKVRGDVNASVSASSSLTARVLA